MINNQWYVTLSSNELRDKPLGLTRFSEKLVFWRGKNNEVCCIKDKCIHRSASLCMGKVVDGEIECPFHSFRYDNTGKCTIIPANGKNSNIPTNFKASSYKTKEAHGFIWVFYGDKESVSEELPFFTELDNFSYHEFKNHWNSGYSRVIENQLDVVHVPFVHKSTIGRGNKTLVNVPLVQVNKDEIIVKVFNSIDDGNLPKDEEILK